MVTHARLVAAGFAEFLNELDVRVVSDAPAGRVRPEDVEGPDAVLLFEQWQGARNGPFVGLDDQDSRIALAGGQFAPEPSFADHAVTEVTWHGARAYCEWRDARLPTEAEWEVAARGRAGRTWPWGEEPPTPERAVFGPARGQTEPVGERPAGATPEGVHDLAGSLAEWTSTLYQPYPYDPADGREDPDDPGERVTRGGDYVFDTTPEHLTTFFRSGFSRAPQSGHRHIGFRCARSAETG